MASPETVLDPGPIPYRAIALFGDPDLEHGLLHAGFDATTTTYRLIEIALAEITDTESMGTWRNRGSAYIDAVRAGTQFPPLVVMRNVRGCGLLDGVNRSYAYWALGITSVVTYELLT
jgi:hypothetical protein